MLSTGEDVDQVHGLLEEEAVVIELMSRTLLKVI